MNTLPLPMEAPANHWQQPLWFAMAGLLTGLAAPWLPHLFTDGASPTWVGLRDTLPFALELFLPVALLLWNGKRRLIIPVYLTTMLLIAGWVGWQAQAVPVGDGNYFPDSTSMSIAYYFLLLMLVVISLPFVQAWQPQRPRFPYPRLFAHAWDNVHSVVMAAAFALLVFVVMLAAAGLFDMLSTSHGEYMLGESGKPLLSLTLQYALPLNLAAFGAGIGVIRQYSTLLLRMHTLVFALYRILAYMLAFIIIAFALMLLPQWQAFLNKPQAAYILFGLVVASILFLNTLVERGSESLPTWAQVLFGTQLLLLPILSALVVHAVGWHIRQYGLSPMRMLDFLLGSLAFIYTLAYAVQFARHRRHWSQGLKAANPPLALLAATLCLLVLTPVLDPQAWSVRHQLARLHSGEVSATAFDYHALRHSFGKPGMDAVATLQGWREHPQYADILKGLEDSKARIPELESVTGASQPHIKLVPASKQTDLNAFLERTRHIQVSGASFGHCYGSISPDTECLLVLQDMNGDGRDEGLLLAFITRPPAPFGGQTEYRIDGNLYLLDEDGLPVDGKGLSNATLQASASGAGSIRRQVYPTLDKAAFEQAKMAAEAGQFSAVMPVLPDVQVGGQRLTGQ